MRIALLSSFETLRGEDSARRSTLRVAGRSILRWQIDFALAQNCEKIVCLANGLPDELVSLQHRVEAAGARFHAVHDMRPLSGLVHSADEVLVLADGVIFEAAIADAALGGRRGVLTLPAEQAVPCGFERIDRAQAWAGVMLVGGALIERLADMPSDIDPHSSLLRVALQAGVPAVPLASEHLVEARWAMADCRENAQRFEAAWIGREARLAGFAAPVSALADRAALAALRRTAEPGRYAKLAAAASWLGLAGAGFCAWQGWAAIGLGGLFLSHISSKFSAMLGDLVKPADTLPKFARLHRAAFPWLADAIFAALAVVAVPLFERTEAGFAALVLLGLLRIALGGGSSWTTRMASQALGDRGLLALLLGGAVALGYPTIALQLLALAALAIGLVDARASRLTQA